MITSILIDIDDTVLDFRLCSRHSVECACENTGVPFSNELFSVFSSVTAELWKKIETGCMTRPELYRIRWKIVFDHLGIVADGVNFEKIFHRALYDSCVPVEGAHELLETLSKKFTVSAASNAPYAQQVNRLERAGLLHFFSHLFISEKIGYEKPSTEFFTHALGILGARPDQVMIIGDSISADIAGGINCGLHTCWFCRGGTEEKNTPESSVHPEYTVKKLSEILSLSVLS